MNSQRAKLELQFVELRKKMGAVTADERFLAVQGGQRHGLPLQGLDDLWRDGPLVSGSPQPQGGAGQPALQGHTGASSRECPLSCCC